MIELTMEQGSLEWHEARSGIVTSTSLSSAVGTPAVQTTLMYQLIAERMAQLIHNTFVSEAMQYGHDTEDMARIVMANHLNEKLETLGMLKSEIVEGFAISPDAVCRRDGKIVGGGEIKCPNSKKHIQRVIVGGIPKEHRHQCLAPFVLSDDIEWWCYMDFDIRNYQLPEYYYMIKREDVIDEVLAMRKRLIEFNKIVDDKYFELCGFEFEGVQSGFTAAPENLIDMMTPMSGKDDGLPTETCKECNERLDASDALLWGDTCSKCKAKL